MGIRTGMLGVGLLGLASIAGCSVQAQTAGGGAADPVLQKSRQDLFQSVNGLSVINGFSVVNGLGAVNGLSAKNGLGAINGLSATNGLSAVNGLPAVNGLSTTNGLNAVNGLAARNGLAAVNGLSVDCGGGKTPGVTCTGRPDGMLSADVTQGGLMAAAGTEATAVYLVRCALNAGDSVQILDYTGSLITLNGEMGLAPAWKTGYLDKDGMEAISSCMMAFTNQQGVHVHIEMNSFQTAARGTSNVYKLGKHDTSSSNWFKYQEGVFYGNLFTSPPTANFCVGRDYAGGSFLLGLIQYPDPVTARMCSSSTSCAYKNVGNCEGSLLGTASAKLTTEIDAIGTGSNPTSGGASAGLFSGGANGASWDYAQVQLTGMTSSCGFLCSTSWPNAIYTYRLDVTVDQNNAY